jgi:hypothetical protein
MEPKEAELPFEEEAVEFTMTTHLFHNTTFIDDLPPPRLRYRSKSIAAKMSIEDGKLPRP